jgi:sterol desaturase/sphingolipid hydroxylase (fatty acid hydroxylase superfamily)
MKDIAFICLSKIQTPPFTYFLMKFMWHEKNAVWDINKATFSNVLVPLPIFFIVYDFFYTILHWSLHIKAVYRFVHKHHHHQKAPSRAQIDAINVHPIEYFLGEYNHLLAVVLCCRVLQLQMHIFCILLILLTGAALASLNHTRYDVVLSIFGIKLFDSKVHDVHHRIPQCNYGQYIMLWDHVFGTFRPYNPEDRINASAQLDPKSGMPMEQSNEKSAKSE